MGKISDQSSLGTRQATAEVELIYGGQNYRQSVSVLFTGFYPADNDATLAANSSSLVPTQAAVKSYVDSSIYGLKWKQSVRAATTAALTLATDFENGDIIDGYTLQTGDRILIKNQVSAIDNGIYVVAASGAPSRAADADSGTELVSASVMVERGTVNADTQWTCTANTIAIGVSNITWAQITSSGVADGDYGDIVVSSGAWALDSAITFSGKTLTGGTLSGVAISGASSIATTVSIDANTSAFTLHDNSDTTKTATFSVSGITTGTNRVFTLPNASGTVALTGAITTSGFSQATGKMLGRSTASTGAIEEITVGTGLSLSAGTLSATGTGSVTTTGSPASGNLTKFSGASSITNGDLSGDVTTSGTLAATIANDAVTYAKMQNVSATARIIGRKTAGSGDPEEMTLSETLDLIGSAAQGDILYRDSSGWARLAAGTSGNVLQTQGAGANPQWAAASGGSLTSSEALCSADTTLSSTPWTDVTGCSLSLASGTWVISIFASLTNTGVTGTAYFKIYNSTDSTDIAAQVQSLTAAYGGSISMTKVVTLAATKTIKFAGYSDNSSFKVLRYAIGTIPGSGINAVKIA